ncbi:MAG: hypothetical protein GAK29_01443 [Acinetobacter bereziniae]|uniref:Uncharacterized protein n=1 Tax=Acinetobacter bereziniae TaxID=106648 RepID=A0A833PGY9_ACIBZ|nr:MAG: hypothetical protein GAK29_01443 [Acinetobacter bereziniae]
MWYASANRQGHKLVPVDTLECALEWFDVVEAEWSGACDLSNDFKHKDLIEAVIGGYDE